MMGTRKFPSGKGAFPPWRRQPSGLLVRRTYVRLRATPRFPCQDEKSPLSESETNSFPSGVSGWEPGIQTMRLWTLHPRFLDCRGLVALWREALLAQAVLSGNTRGYLHHPQLLRFRNTAAPLSSIASYLQAVLVESARRGYRFDASKIPLADTAELIVTSQGQLDYEWTHLKAKLRVRDPYLLSTMESIARPDPHPLFRIVPGLVEGWEVVQPLRPTSRRLPA